MSASVMRVKVGYGNAGKKFDPSGPTPLRSARMKSASVQRPMPCVGSEVMLGP